MKISQLKLEGFRGFRNQATIPVASGFTVITGRNGSGKSSICDAIEYVICGNLSRFTSSDVEGGERISDYLWWRDGSASTNRRVTASFQFEDGHIEERVATPDGVGNDSATSGFYDESSAPTDALTRLCQTAIIRDELITRLSTDLPEADRFELFYRTVGIADLSDIERRARRLYDGLRDLARKLENEYAIRRERVSETISEISEARIASSKAAGTDISAVRQRLASLSNASVDLPVDQLIKASKVATTNLRLRTQRLERLRTDLSQSVVWRAQLAELEARSSTLRQQVETTEESLKQLAVFRDRSNEELKTAHSRDQAFGSLAQLTEHGRRVGLQSGKCPLCGSEITEADFENHLTEIRRRLDEHNKSLRELSAQEATRTAQYSRVRSELEAFRREYRKVATEIEALRGNSVLLDKEAKALAVALDPAAIERAISDCTGKTSALDGGLAEIEGSTALERIREMDKQRSLAEQDVDAIAKRIETVSLAAQNAKAAEDAARRVSWEAVDDCMAALSPLLAELYSRLKPHVDYTEVRYRMRGDVKRFLSFTVGNDINPRFTFSSGQRRALGLAFLLAIHLSRRWCNLKTLILDDPIQHIDDYRALRFAEVLSSIRQTGHQVICTIEDPELADLLCRRLRSKTEDDGIRVDLEYEPGTGARIHRVRRIAPLPERVLLSA